VAVWKNETGRHVSSWGRAGHSQSTPYVDSFIMQVFATQRHRLTYSKANTEFAKVHMCLALQIKTPQRGRDCQHKCLEGSREHGGPIRGQTQNLRDLLAVGHAHVAADPLLYARV
jgi:hypothetical protein